MKLNALTARLTAAQV
jgi:hypothetical protein